ncbi:hypothetical protein GOBAR_DD02049 [Gossypium barbadense]|nr:hypothetical protein GOBAR_DD02049 [Gossypium barbadense]
MVALEGLQKRWERTDGDERNMTKVSYKAKLLGDETGSSRNVSMKKDFELKDENVVTEMVVWICLPRLLEGVYSKSLLWAISSMIGPVFRIDARTDTTVRGRFARLVVSVNLKKPLISKIRVNYRIQRVKHECLPNVFFSCELYGHSSTLCFRGKPDTMFDVAVAYDSGVEKVTDFEGSGETRVESYDGVRADVMKEILLVSSVRKEMTRKIRNVASLSRRKLIKAVLGDVEIRRKEARVKGKRISGLIGLKTNEGVLKPNNGGVGSIFEKNPSGSDKDDMLGRIATWKEVVEDKSNVDIIIRRKLPDYNMGHVEQPTLELSSAMEGIVRNLHRDREWFNVESSSLKEGKSLEVGFNRGVGNSEGVGHPRFYKFISEYRREFSPNMDLKGAVGQLHQELVVFIFRNSCSIMGFVILDVVHLILHGVEEGSLKPHRVGGTRPFRCLNSWILHPEFRMLKIQKVLELRSSNRLRTREMGLRQEMEEVLKHEKNTKYFHGRTLARHRRNKIEGLKVDGVNWCFYPGTLKHHVINFYKSLFALDYSIDRVLPCRG